MTDGTSFEPTPARDLGQARLELKAAHIAARHASDHAEQVTADRDMYRDRYFAVQRVLDEALGPNGEDGTGEGIAADVHLLAQQRDAARAEVERLRVSLEEASAVITQAGWRISPSHPAWVILDGFDGSGDACREMEGRGYTRSGTGGWHPPTPAAEATPTTQPCGCAIPPEIAMPAGAHRADCPDWVNAGPSLSERRYVRRDAEATPDAALLVPPGQLKMLREDLCLSRSTAWPGARRRFNHLIAEIDRHRPLGPDGVHGDRHTPTCGCEDKPSTLATPDEPAPIPCVAAELEVQHPAHAVGRPEADVSCPGFPATPDEPAPDNVGDGDRWEDPRDTVGGHEPAPSRAPNCDAEDAPLYMGLDGAWSCRCVVCARCGRHTGNSNQGHYWAFCRDQPLTRTTRKGKRVYNRQPHHFCCPPPHGCALDEDAQAEGEPAPSDPASLTEVVLMQEAHASVTLDGETVALGPVRVGQPAPSPRPDPQLYVDFNDTGDEFVYSMVEAADTTVDVGARVIARDEDGNTCPGEIIDRLPSRETVKIRLDMSAFRAAPHLEP